MIREGYTKKEEIDHQQVLKIGTKRLDPPESYKSSSYDRDIWIMFLGCAYLSTAPILQKEISKKMPNSSFHTWFDFYFESVLKVPIFPCPIYSYKTLL